MAWYSGIVDWTKEKAENISTTASGIADSVVSFANDPIGKTAAGIQAVGEYAQERGVLGVATDVVRTPLIASQGLVSGLASGVGALGDLGMNLGYDWTTRHLINLFRDEPLQALNLNLAGRAGNAVMIPGLEPRNGWERTIFTGNKVVGEIAGFIGITVATGGTAGLLAGGGAVAARTASGVARFMNPLASRTAATIEGSFGTLRFGDIYGDDLQAAQLAQEAQLEAVNTMSEGGLTEQQDLQETLQAILDERKELEQEITRTDLSEEEVATLKERVGNNLRGESIIKELRGELSDKRRAELHDELDTLYPNEPQSEEPQENLEETVETVQLQQEAQDHSFAHEDEYEIISEDLSDLDMTALVSQQGDMNTPDADTKDKNLTLDVTHKQTPIIG